MKLWREPCLHLVLGLTYPKNQYAGPLENETIGLE